MKTIKKIISPISRQEIPPPYVVVCVELPSNHTQKTISHWHCIEIDKEYIAKDFKSGYSILTTEGVFIGLYKRELFMDKAGLRQKKIDELLGYNKST